MFHCPKTLQWHFISFRIKAKVFSITSPMLATLVASLWLKHARHTLNQGLCIYCSLWLKAVSQIDSHKTCSFWVFTQKSPSWTPYLKLKPPLYFFSFCCFNSLCSTYFSLMTYYIVFTHLVYCLPIPLECKLHWSKRFCLFCSLLHL